MWTSGTAGSEDLEGMACRKTAIRGQPRRDSDPIKRVREFEDGVVVAGSRVTIKAHQRSGAGRCTAAGREAKHLHFRLRNAKEHMVDDQDLPQTPAAPLAMVRRNPEEARVCTCS